MGVSWWFGAGPVHGKAMKAGPCGMHGVMGRDEMGKVGGILAVWGRFGTVGFFPAYLTMALGRAGGTNRWRG